MTPVATPPLDARTFQQIVDAGKQRIAGASPDWNDLSPSDPGVVLLEVFAYLTESVLFRLNRLPDRSYDAFLRLIGITRQPPSAATVRLTFTRAGQVDSSVVIPRGTRVTVTRTAGASDAPVFVLVADATIRAAATLVEATAYHAEPVAGELAAIGTGLPAQTVTARRSPIVEQAGDDLALIVATQMAPGDSTAGVKTIDWDGAPYRIWREVDNFSNLSGDRFVYIADRSTGTVTFAPVVRQLLDTGTLSDQPTPLAEAPPAQRPIRLWYWTGGGPAGNVAENTLAVLKDPIAGVQVTNEARATGGRAAETLDNARARGPIEFRRLERAVTARDFEDLARRSSAVARALAVTKVALWTHAAPGTVQVFLVPSAPDLAAAQYRLTPAAFQAYQTDSARLAVQQALDERRPLGTACEVGWAKIKTVTVRARVVVHCRADPSLVEREVLARLSQMINPVPTPAQPDGWPFGRPLRSWDINQIVEAVPGVQYADNVQLLVDSAPDAMVESIAAAVAQPGMWFAGSDDTLFRTGDDGDGWEQVARFPGQRITAVRPHPDRPGLVAIVSTDGDLGPSHVYLSADCLESAPAIAQGIAARVHDAAWILQDGEPLLLFATPDGLFQLVTSSDARPNPVPVAGTSPEPGVYAVAALTDARGVTRVAVATMSSGGVYLSEGGGRSGTFRLIGLQGKDIRRLVIQDDGERVFLWAGVTAAGFETGDGCYRAELTAGGGAPTWRLIGANWSVLSAGSCHAIDFRSPHVIVGSERRGVLWHPRVILSCPWVVSRCSAPAPRDSPRPEGRGAAPVTTFQRRLA